MASTPPMQITLSPQTPQTPLHGPTFDRTERRPTRQSARINQQNIHRSPVAETPRNRKSRAQYFVTTPDSSEHASHHSLDLQPHSPRLTPRPKSTRRVQVVSPSSSDAETSAPNPPKPINSNLHPFASSSTIMSEGMLPTPVKTPKKNQLPGINAAARALFQDHVTEGYDVGPGLKRGRKTKRYNGFSLESFNVDDPASRNRIQIFTDSRDQVPEVDVTEANPFIQDPTQGDHVVSKKLARSSKRRKLSGEKRVDPQVDEAIKNDEGMVYVFRGKKVYRRFDDKDDEEEEIDAEDLGLLEHSADASTITKPLKTLTRKSIRPTRLFQTEEQKRARELEKEEEATTDVEDQFLQRPVERSSLREDDSAVKGESSILPNSRSLRSNTKAASADDLKQKPKKASPFDSWVRLKAGSRRSGSGGTSTGEKTRKRPASSTLDDETDGTAFDQSPETKRVCT